MDDWADPATAEADAAVLEARAAELARVTADAAEERFIDIIPFAAAGQAYAVPAAGVREVRRLQAVAWIPTAPASLLGITRVRSTVVPVFDLEALLGLDERPAASQSQWVLVLDDTHHPALGLAADSVDGVRAQALGDIVQPEAGPTPLSLGVTVDGAVVLDVEALLAAPAVFDAPAAGVPQELHLVPDRGEPKRGSP